MGSLSMQRSMEPLQMLALFMYTQHSAIFEAVNKTLSNWDQPSATVWQPFVMCLNQALLSMPCYEGECYRAIDSPFDLEKLALGETLVWDHFSSASLQWNNCVDLVNAKRGVIFIIKTKTARVIAQYSGNSSDSQVVLLPHTTLKVTHHYVGNAICLAQQNIRNKTYKLLDYTKVTQNKACAIVQLEEL